MDYFLPFTFSYVFCLNNKTTVFQRKNKAKDKNLNAIQSDCKVFSA